MWIALRHIARLTHILAMLARRGILPGRTIDGAALAKALEELGPAFVKFGQAFSTRADLIGEAMAAELAVLRDSLPPFPFAEAKAIIEADLGETLQVLFSTFEAEPVAAASIAQVHKAITPDGRTVAVKVVRPGIRRALERDLALFQWMAETARRLLPKLRRLKPTEVVRTLQDMVAFEIDMRSEAAAASELRENMRKYAGFRVPEIDWARTSQRVLTSEWIDGIGINDAAAVRAAGFDPDALLRTAAEAFFLQVFRDGYFHGDLHPGNVFVDEKGRIATVDFGIMGRVDMQSRRFLAEMLRGFLAQDYRRVAEVHAEAGYLPKGQSLEQFALALRAINEPIMGRPLAEISVAKLLAQLFQVTAQFQMETQPQLLLLQKSMMMTEGIGRMLNPSVNIWQVAEPLIVAWGKDNLGVKARAREAAAEGRDLLLRLPPLARSLEAMLAETAREGIRLHPDSLRAYARSRRESSGVWTGFAWGLAFASLVVMLVVLLAS